MATNSLHRQTLLQVLPVSLCLLLLVGSLTYWSVSVTVTREVQNRVDTIAFNRSNELDAKLKLVAEACIAAAESDVLINGIVDEEYRNAVTIPFLRSFRLPGGNHQEITMTDYRGRPLAGIPHDQVNADWLPDVMRGQTKVTIQGPDLIVATPVKYTNHPEAAFVVRYVLTEFLQDVVQGDTQSKVVISSHGVPICTSFRNGTNVDLSPAKLQQYIHATWACENVPGTSVKVLESKLRALHPTRAVRNALLGTAALAIWGFLFVIWYVSNQVAHPVTQLLQQIQCVQTTGDLSFRVDTTGAREFVEIKNRLNQMLGSLEQKTVSLDRYQAAQQQLALALKGGNIGTWDWNAQTNEVQFSDILKAQLGYSPDANWTNFDDWRLRLHPDDSDHALQVVQDYFSHRTDRYESTFRLRCNDGSYRWIYARGVAEFDPQGQPSRMLGVHVDIHDRIEDEEKLKNLNAEFARQSRETQAANRELQQSNSELEQFAYVASHDLQEPLRKVRAFCELLQDEYAEQLGGDGSHYIETIVNSAGRMKDLISDLLAYSRVKSQEGMARPVSANQALACALNDLSATIESSQAQITYGDLPDVWVYKQHLVQVFQNLISNGIKYQTQEIARVHIEAVTDGDECIFSVQDNGIGIAPEYHEQIFGVFKRLHNRRHYPGTGIGLAICKRIMERSHGRIWLESQEGEGTTFYFALPVGAPVEEILDAEHYSAESIEVALML